MTKDGHYRGELEQKLGIEVLKAEAQEVIARMPVEGNRQVIGLLHGGATAALAEFCGSLAAFLHAQSLGKVPVGVDLSVTHHRSMREGYVRAYCTPIKVGRTLTSHEIIIEDEATGKRTTTARITNMLIDREGDADGGWTADREGAVAM